MFKYQILTALSVSLLAGYAVAQENDASTSGYNHISLSYDATFNFSNYTFLDDAEGVPGNFTLNGMSINYLHGFHLPVSLPMFIETGASLGFNTGSYVNETFDFDFGGNLPSVSVDSRLTQSYRNFNLEVPVFYLYRFQPSSRFSIAPYVGVNFKIHLSTRIKEKWKGEENGEYDEEDSGWHNAYDKDVYGSIWKRFQFGPGIGVRLALDNRWTFAVQYIQDLNPAADLKENMNRMRVYTGVLKFAIGYKF